MRTSPTAADFEQTEIETQMNKLGGLLVVRRALR